MGDCDCLATVRISPEFGSVNGWEWRFCPLHAAAPDLLAALEQLAEAKWDDELQIQGEWGVSTDPGFGEPSAELTAARAAIAKAKGEG